MGRSARDAMRAGRQVKFCDIYISRMGSPSGPRGVSVSEVWGGARGASPRSIAGDLAVSARGPLAAAPQRSAGSGGSQVAEPL